MKKTVFIFIFSFWIKSLLAYIPMNSHGRPSGFSKTKKTTGFAGDCAQSKSQIDLNVNNVRARLQGGGDLWWDLKGNGRYIVPANTAKEVVSIFAAGPWIGGLDEGKNLRTACTLFRGATDNDWWSGPLNSSDGNTDEITCANWDIHFSVTSKEINEFKEAYKKAAKDANGYVSDASFIDKISKTVLAWPAKGNPYFSNEKGFSLPKNTGKLADYYDKDNNGIYDPRAGDFPYLIIRSACNNDYQPDEMIFWIFNDNGGVHTQSNGLTTRTEIHATSFAYSTNDDLNNTTFLHYKTMFRGSENIDSAFFGFWVDVDLGCYRDDYIGVDTVMTSKGKKRTMAYAYNEDAIDGQPGVTCYDVNTYGSEPPIIAIEQIGDLNLSNENIETSFMYMNNNSAGSPPPPTQTAVSITDFYNYLNARWRDGTPLSIGGNGYSLTNTDPKKNTKLAFFDEPKKVDGWSMAQANIPFGDRQILLSHGSFQKKPGEIRSYLYSIPWVANQGGGKVDLKDIRKAADLARAKFENCFSVASNEAIIDENKAISIYPNPFSKKDQDRLVLKNIEASSDITIFTSDGKTIFLEKNLMPDDKKNIELKIENSWKNKANGIYFISIKNKNQTKVLPCLVLD